MFAEAKAAHSSIRRPRVRCLLTVEVYFTPGPPRTGAPWHERAFNCSLCSRRKNAARPRERAFGTV
eukprot:scaffold73177_cov69-Phaeocystis_antarctica.AAC.5